VTDSYFSELGNDSVAGHFAERHFAERHCSTHAFQKYISLSPVDIQIIILTKTIAGNSWVHNILA
jgi:hypothetical protein